MALNKEIIRNSFEAIKPIATEFVDHFYTTLFKKYPQAKKLFSKVNMENQKRALLNSLVHCVEYLDEEDHLVDYLKKMGIRHQGYGVKEEHYAWVGDALVSTLKFYFGENWSGEAEESWVALYTFMSEQMLSGLKNVAEFSAGEFDRDILEREIQNFARNHVRSVFKEIIEEDLSRELKEMIRGRIREILKTAVEKEAEDQISSLKKSAA